jgi:dTDP-4-dehydrorhamnose 3,5-epimerase
MKGGSVFRVRETSLPGCHEIFAQAFHDGRGAFVKVLHRDEFLKAGLETCYAEEYYTWSRKRVLRGLHFQNPPMDHIKLVYCVHGEVMDVVLDLRRGSPTYGKHEIFSLGPEKTNMVYIPSGLAHGFYVTGQDACMIYKVTTVYSPEHDKGILWNSVGISWPDDAPVLSGRDCAFPTLESFDTPFVYEKRSGR